MPATYDPIATTTLGSAAANITFSGISSAYTDLRLIISSLSATTDAMYLRFNGDSGTNYSYGSIDGDGTSVGAGSGINNNRCFLTFFSLTSTTIPSFFDINIFSYTGSKNKTCLTRTTQDYNGSGAGGVFAHLWRNTGAITSITFGGQSYNLSAGTTATLYGILRA
jgi:hypothetical protein